MLDVLRVYLGNRYKGQLPLSCLQLITEGRLHNSKLD